jgi:hypothetical protein
VSSPAGDAAAPPVDEPPAAAPPRGEPAVAPDDAAREPGFETYVAPPPLRPPVDEPAAAAPPPVEAEPPAAPPPVEAQRQAPPAEGSPAVPPLPVDGPPDRAPAATPPAPSTPTPEPVAAAPADELGATVMPEALKRGPAEPAAPRERPSRAFPIALGGALVAAIVAGVLIGGGGSDDDGGGEQNASMPVTPADGGAVQLKVPRSYAALASAPAIPGLDLVDGAGYAPGGKDGGRAVAFGATEANDSTLMPQDFRGALGLRSGEVPERTPVKLGPDGLQAYRYEGLEPAGIERQVTLYTSPTSEGVATVACLAPPADAAAFKAECEAIANTMQITSGKAFPVGPDQEFAKTLGATLGKLDDQVAKGRKALTRDGAAFRAQGRAAGDIQAAYAAAARQLRRAEVSPADAQIRASLVGDLNAAAAAWKKAAAAAVRKDERGFARSETAIKRTRQKLAATIAGLANVGYEIQQ